MKKFLKILGIFCLLSSLILLAGWATYENTFEIQRNLPTFTEIKKTTNISGSLYSQQRATIQKSRESAVHIISYSTRIGGITSLSGTYFTAFGKYYVLTVMHGLGNNCGFTKIIIDNGKFYDCKEYIIINVIDDYAIMEVEKIAELTPVRVPNDLPKNKEWSKDISMLTQIYHTGYPNNMGPLTFDGKIVGYSDEEHIYINSFAWSGSSGSGVFNKRGKLIGYVLAIDIGTSEYGIDILEDIVVVVPTSVVNWDYFFEFVLNIDKLKNRYSLENIIK